MIYNALFISTKQRDSSVNTPPQSSRGIAVLACLEEVVILVVGVVLVARVSGRVGVATNAHMNVLLPASCRQKRFQIYCGIYCSNIKRENCPRAN
jgi:hypothetical protein